MNNSKNKRLSQIAFGILVVFGAAGCASTDPPMSKAQEDAIRHPVADPSYKGPSPDASAKMEENIANFNKKHEHDKVEFTK